MVSALSTPSAAGTVRPRRRRAAAVTGLLVALLVLAGGALFWQSQPQQDQAESTLVVLPDAASDEAASYYDTLSSGQIATTFAEILALRGGEGAAPGVDVEVEVVPGTSLITVTATAEDGATAEAEADAALERARPFFDQLAGPYDVSVVSPAAGTAETTGLALPIVAGVVLAVALVAGLAAYLAVSGLQQARDHARRAAGAGSSLPPVPARVPAPAPEVPGPATNPGRGPRDTVDRPVVEVRPPQTTR